MDANEAKQELHAIVGGAVWDFVGRVTTGDDPLPADRLAKDAERFLKDRGVTGEPAINDWHEAIHDDEIPF